MHRSPRASAADFLHPQLRPWTILLLSPLLFLALSCGGGSTTEPNPGPVSWDLGATTTYDVQESAGGAVVDTVTGHSFYFPEGGDGVLSVARVLDGPAAPYPGDGFWVEWTGAEPVQVDVEDTESEFDMLLTWTVPAGSFSNAREPSPDGERWVAVAPTDTVEGAIRYELPLPHEAGSPRTRPLSAGSVGVPASQHFQSASVPVGSQEQAMLNNVTKANQFVATWVDSLPASLQAGARARVKVLKPSFYADDNYYIGFARYFWGKRTMPMFGLEPNAPDKTVAHEVGHYMSHVLLGDEAYFLLEETAPQNHGIGEVHAGRSNMTEEYAHFSEYFLTGSLGAADPAEPAQLFHGMNPKSADYPSREGFACSFLARLHTTDPTVRKLTDPGTKLPIPVVGASFTDLIGILAQGPVSMNRLRALVEDYLTTKGNADMLPVILERIGWRYMGTGRLVDPDGDPLRNVTVRKVAKVGGKEYYPTSALTTTDDKGKLGTTHFFPGSTYLRVYQDGDSVDVPIYVNPDLATDADLDLGDITVDFSNLLRELHEKDGISVTLNAEHMTNYGPMYESDTTFEPDMSGVIWNGTAFDVVQNSTGSTYTSEKHVTGSVSADGRSVESFTYTYRFRSNTPNPSNGILREEVDVSVTIGDVAYTDTVFGSLRYRMDGPQVGNHVVLSYRRLVEWEDPGLGTTVTEYTGTDWNSTTTVPELAIYFD